MVAPVWLQFVDLLVAVCFILGLKGLSGPKTARNGNLIGAVGAIAAVVVLFIAHPDMNNLPLIIGAIVIGLLIGVPAARGVKMTAMPQMVALFNGVGGGAAALISIIEFFEMGVGEPGAQINYGALAATVFTVVIGSIAFTGSILTFLKLQELITTRPIVLPAGPFVTGLVAVATLVAAVWLLVAPSTLVLIVLLALSLLAGIMLVLPVGGADVPIVISLLNAFTGLSVAASGYVLGNVLLIVAGTLVGAAGTLLTREMAHAMGRSVSKTMFGAFTATAAASAGSGEERPVKTSTAQDVAIMLEYASKVLIVPGYGLAVAQAQQTIRELADLLSEKGIDVAYAIHPVAGRMPGHMNVLLAEANVPYEQLRELDDVNPEFASTDVVIVVGANDVVNPAAKSDPNAPIYGMPILDVSAASQVVFLKRSMRPGFAGIENELLYQDGTTLLFGDAKASLTDVVSAVKEL